MRTYLRVGALIFHKGRIVTTKMRKKDKEYYVLPGGGVEKDETIEEAIKREVKEEINIEIKKLRLAYIKELNLKIEGGGRGIEFYFIVEDYTGEPKKGFDPEEKESSFESIEFIDPGELKKIEFHPEQLVNHLNLKIKESFSKVKHLGLYDYP